MPMTEERKTFGEMFAEIEEEIDAEAEAGEPEAEGADSLPAEDKVEEKLTSEEDKGEEKPAPEGEETKLAEQLEEKRQEEEVAVEEKTPSRFEVTIDGKSREVDRDELVRGYQTAQSSTRRFQDAKKLHAETKAFFQEYVKSPGEALVSYYERQVKDPLKAREMVRDTFLEFLAPDLEEAAIEDENEKKLRRREREIEEKQRSLERKEREAKDRAQREADEEFISSLKGEIEQGLKRFGLPDTNVVWGKVSSLLGAAEEAGSSRPEILGLVDVALKQVKDERDTEAKALVSTLSAEQLEAMFPEQAKNLRARRVERVKEEISTPKETVEGEKSKEEIETELKEVAEKRRGGRKRLNRRHFTSDEVFDSIPTS